jgi:hypothetical protein
MKTFNDNMSIKDFDAWSGAKDTKQTIIDNNKEDEFDRLIEELYPDGLSETQLNDILWFESDWVFENLGISEEEEENN